MRLLLLIIIYIGLKGTLIQAQDTTALRGQLIQLPKKYPISNAWVIINKKWQAKTDKDGHFSVPVPNSIRKDTYVKMSILLRPKGDLYSFDLKKWQVKSLLAASPQVIPLRIPVHLLNIPPKNKKDQEDKKPQEDTKDSLKIDSQSNKRNSHNVQKEPAPIDSLQSNVGETNPLRESKPISLANDNKRGGADYPKNTLTHFSAKDKNIAKNDIPKRKEGNPQDIFKKLSANRVLEEQPENPSMSGILENLGVILDDLGNVFPSIAEEFNDIIEELQKIKKELNNSLFLWPHTKKKLNDALNQLENRLRKLETKFENFSDDQKRLLSIARNELADARALLRNSWIISIYLLIGLITFLFSLSILVGYLFYLLRKVKKQRTELEIIGQGLEESLGQKKLLLKEIHHRVKNNLQTIWGLLYLQSLNISDPQTLRALQEGRNRIYSVSLVHEKLYDSKDIEQINFKKFADQLIHTIVDTFKNGQRNINHFIDSEEAFFDIETSRRLGMIINELITNCYKYAFQGRQKGNIWIKLQQNESQAYELSVTDDGVGLPKIPNIEKSKTLGFTIVYRLSRELRGELKIDSQKNRGTTFSIQFEKPRI